MAPASIILVEGERALSRVRKGRSFETTQDGKPVTIVGTQDGFEVLKGHKLPDVVGNPVGTRLMRASTSLPLEDRMVKLDGGLKAVAVDTNFGDRAREILGL